MATINIGDLARCKITGFEGVCIARTEWLHGCARINLQPRKLDKDGKIQESRSFDEPQLDLIKKSVIETSGKEDPVTGKKATGGPCDNPAVKPEPDRGRD